MIVVSHNVTIAPHADAEQSEAPGNLIHLPDMSFQWQKLDDAAATLEVDLDTLRQWIDEGRAPTRTTDGVTEVLIEFPDESGDHAPDEAAAEPHIIDADFDDHTPHTPHALQVASRRELQLAGTVAAAWQRMAEQAEREVTRSRRISTIGWITVALLTFLAAAGIYYTTRQTADAEKQTALTQQKLDTTTASRDELAAENKALNEKLDKLTADLNDLKTEHAAAQQRITQLEAALNQQKQQTDDLRQTLSDLRSQLKSERDQSAKLNKQLDAAKKQAAQADQQITDLRKQIETLQKPKAEPREASDQDASDQPDENAD